MDIDDALRRRFWVRDNFEWLMSEVIFHREMKEYFKNPKVKIWELDNPEGKANIYEAAQ